MTDNKVRAGQRGREQPARVLEALAEKRNLDPCSLEFARYLDSQDPLKDFRHRFDYPKSANLPYVEPGLLEEGGTEECVYLCGNSLGLRPKTVEARVMRVLADWRDLAVESHFQGSLPAALCDRLGRESLGRLLGAEPSSVVLMNGLTVNLHLLLLSFYRPSPARYKIMIEGQAFPSDRYAVASQAKLHGYDPEEAVVQVFPRPGEHILRTEDVIKVLKEQGPSISVVCLSGVHYYTGQRFDMERITRAGQEQGCAVGWDLAHSIGNVEIKLDEWGVDFACWCSYKYLNSGPGSIAGAYVNQKHNNSTRPRLAGWWSNKDDTRFEMLEECDMALSVDSYRLCNPPPLLVTEVLASLEIFDEAGMERILAKQFLLTGYLELLVRAHFTPGHLDRPSATIITPEDARQRGSQLSLIFSYPLKQVHAELRKRGIVCDIRQPNVMRISPAPLYNSYSEVHRFVTLLEEVFLLCKTVGA